MKAWNYLQKTLDLSLNTEIIKQAHGLMMEDEKDVLAGEYRKSPAFAGYNVFALAGHIERYLEGATLRFHETKKDDPIMAAKNLFGNIINIHPFEDGNRRICRLILAHVLMQMKCCLFPVIFSSFHRRRRRHYIRTVNMFDRKPSMLYTLIVKSLVHCWDNFKQNARMLVGRHLPQIKNDLAGARNLINMSFLVQRSNVKSFEFNGKNVQSVHVNVEECLVSRDVYMAIWYEEENDKKTIQNLVPKKYKLRFGDVNPLLNQREEIFSCCIRIQPC